MGKRIWKGMASFLLCLCILILDSGTAAEAAPSWSGMGGSARQRIAAMAGKMPSFAVGSGETKKFPDVRATAKEAFHPLKENTYYELLAPTQLVKLGDTYYLVDSYHHQILCSKRLEPSAFKWEVMVDGLNRPHAIAGDGAVFLVTDTDNHRVISYVKSEDPEGYTEKQVFDGIGERPHYVVYDAATGLFYVWSSMTGEMFLFRRKPDTAEVYLEDVKKIPELNGKYVRSFTIEDGRIYFPCVPDSAIVAADQETFSIEAVYPVPEKISGMVQLIKIQNYYYLTVSTDINYNKSAATMVRARTLEDFAAGSYEDVGDDLEEGKVPYYISEADGSYYTVVMGGSTPACGYRFDVAEDEFCNRKKGATAW